MTSGLGGVHPHSCVSWPCGYSRTQEDHHTKVQKETRRVGGRVRQGGAALGGSGKAWEGGSGKAAPPIGGAVFVCVHALQG
jgi:hypothetical protein